MILIAWIPRQCDVEVGENNKGVFHVIDPVQHASDYCICISALLSQPRQKLKVTLSMH